MKVLVVHRREELFERFKAFCEKSDAPYFRNLEIDYARDTNAKRLGNFERYVQKMEKEGPEWIEPDPAVLEKIEDADILLTEWGGISSRVIAAGKALKLIATIRSGCENINVRFAHARGVAVSISPSRLAEPVADMAIALMLSEVRGIVRRNLRSNHGAWVEEKYDDESHSALCNLRVGLVGYGGIARTMAKRLVHGFGSEVVAYETITPESVLRADGVEPVSLEALCRTCDIISVHARLVPETRHMIGAEQFAQMKPNAIFINTARAGLVDEAALMRALDSGRISYCALDVLGTENFSESPLLHRENVILTPHISWCSEAALAELQKKTAQNVVETFLHGEPIYRAV